jgi:hypothetical protein
MIPLCPIIPSPPETAKLSSLLRQVARQERLAIFLEARILKLRIAIQDWYTAHPVQSLADFEPKSDRP